jgi:hypothetical protein
MARIDIISRASVTITSYDETVRFVWLVRDKQFASSLDERERERERERESDSLFGADTSG